MRSTLAYTSSRIVLFLAALVLLRLAGLDGLLLWAFAFLISALVSYVLLSSQRDAMSRALAARFRGKKKERAGWRARLEAGATAEDDDAGGAGAQGLTPASRRRSAG